MLKVIRFKGPAAILTIFREKLTNATGLEAGRCRKGRANRQASFQVQYRPTDHSPLEEKAIDRIICKQVELFSGLVSVICDVVMEEDETKPELGGEG